MKKKLTVFLVTLSMIAALGLVGCGGGNNPVQNVVDDASNAVSQLLEGDVTGQVGKEYATKWFKFTINSLETASSFAGYNAADGNTLVIANITITNTFGSTQPFGTFDWFVDDDSLAEYLWPMAPLNDTMMPESFDLPDGQTVTYTVVVEIPANLANPYFMYTEVDSEGNSFTTFRVPIK